MRIEELEKGYLIKRASETGKDQREARAERILTNHQGQFIYYHKEGIRSRPFKSALIVMTKSWRKGIVMESEKREETVDKEIIGYRIGKDVICPDCYKNIASDPVKGPEKENSGIPLKADHLKFYVCQRCGANKGDSTFALSGLLSIQDALQKKDGGGTEKEKGEEIIGYRTRGSFLCPNHYQMSVKILAVHNIELPAKALKKGDVESFTCDHCEDEKNEGKLAKEMEREEKRRIAGVCDAVVRDMNEIERIRGYSECSLDMIGEIDVMRRKARFIKKTLHLASEGRRLTRKNLLTLRDFFDNLGENLDGIRNLIGLNFFDSMDHREMLAKQARGYFCSLPRDEQKRLGTEFGVQGKYDYDQERIGEGALPS